MNHSSPKEGRYMLMAFTGNAIFGFSFLFSKLALDVAEPFVLLTVRFFTAFALMSLLQVFGVVRCDLKGKNLLPLFTLGLLQPVFYFICESYGILYTSSSFSGIIIALCPIAGLVFGSVLLREHPTGLQTLFSILSVSGVLVMTAVDGLGEAQWKGFLFLLGAVASGALFNVQSRRISTQFTAFERTFVMFGVGTVVFGGMGLVQTRGDWSLWTAALTNGGFWVSILYLSCVSSVGAFLLLNKALDVLDVTRTLVFANVTTVISVLAGVVVLRERFSMVQAAGIVMVLAGVYGVNRFVGNSNQ